MKYYGYKTCVQYLNKVTLTFNQGSGFGLKVLGLPLEDSNQNCEL